VIHKTSDITNNEVYMSEETKTEVPELPEVKATIVFMCNLNPHPVTKFDCVHSVRAGKMYLPAVHGKARLPDDLREYEVDFPLSILDTDKEEGFNNARKFLHERVDEAFDRYLEKWKKVQQTLKDKKAVNLKEYLDKKKEEKEQQTAAAVMDNEGTEKETINNVRGSEPKSDT
jgi:hypothetical protein